MWKLIFYDSENILEQNTIKENHLLITGKINNRRTPPSLWGHYLHCNSISFHKFCSFQRTKFISRLGTKITFFG